MVRRFVPLACLAAAVAAPLTLAVAREGEGPADGMPGAEARRSGSTFAGSSERGDFQEALDRAVESALRSLPGADRMVRYRVREITGERGGIRGANTLRVSIELTDRQEARPPADDDPGNLARALRAELQLSESRVRQDERVQMTLEVRNRSDARVVLPFSSGQKYDFEVWRGERMVWRWSQGRYFTQALVRQPVEPGETLTFRTTWNLRDSEREQVRPGEYEVRAYLTIRGDRRLIGDKTRLTVAE